METILRPIPLAQLLRLFAESRVQLFVSSMIYAVALTYCLVAYAAIEWPQYGFSFGGVNSLDATMLSAAVLIWSAVLPKRIDRPSSLFLIVIYLFVCVPGAVAMVGLDRPSEGYYHMLLLSLTIGFALACTVVRSFSWRGPARESSDYFLMFLILAWTMCLVVLLFSFGSIMSFSELDDIYLQRERGAAGNLFEGYAQTYFGYVFSPALLAFGLVKRHYLLVLAGFCGALVLYMITAEKAVFMYPLFVVALFAILRSKLKVMTSVSFIAIVFSAALFLSVFFYADSGIAGFVSWYLGIRSLLIPGAFVTYYSDFFSEHGYTLFSHISGIGLIVDTPASYLSHPRWPSIGHLVGEDYLGVPTLNANASFIASDGVASLGAAGVFVALMLFASFLIVLDRCARGVQPALVLPLVLPLALTLTNGSLFTALTSFGGAFWILCLAFVFGRKRHFREVIFREGIFHERYR